MVIHYRNFEIEAFRDSGIIHYSITEIDEGTEHESGFYDTEDTVRNFINGLKDLVDDIIEKEGDD